MPKSVKTLLAGSGGAAFIAALHRLFDPNQCAAFLNEHTAVISAGGAILGIAMLWVQRPGSEAKDA